MGNERKIKLEQIDYGFKYGPASVTRLMSDDKEGWVMIGIETDSCSGCDSLHIYVTKTGKVRVFQGNKEWNKPRPTWILSKQFPPPRDGTYILAQWGKKRPVVVNYYFDKRDKEGWWESWGMGTMPNKTPTRWAEIYP